MFQNMSPQEQDFLKTLENNEATMKAEMVQMRQLIQQQADAAMAAGAAGFGMGGTGGGKSDGGERARAILNRKDFGLVDTFDGTQAKFKSWFFDLLTAMGSVDQSLTKATRELLKTRPKIVMEGGSGKSQMIWPWICLFVMDPQIT